MKFHPEEYSAAEEYWKDRSFPKLSDEQRRVIVERGRELLKFPRRHPAVHHLISLSAFFIIFGVDHWVLLRMGFFISSPVLAGLLIGVLHAYMMYSLLIYTLHEGAAHKLIVLRGGLLAGFFSKIANNAGRIALAEADYYAKSHLEHHAHFTTPKDGEFLNFVFAKRLFKSLLPYASILNFADFKAHAGMKYTPSRVLSITLFLIYHAYYVILMIPIYSTMTIIIAFVLVAPNLAFWFDRLRQYTEHNLTPLDTVNGARDLGPGFWGILIGGGPWGQPCHWTHHLYPGVPWYNQIRLHNFIKKILTPEQKGVFFIKPITGYPRTLFKIIKATGKYRQSL